MQTPESMKRIQSLLRWRAGLLFAALLVPGLLYLLFERQARRLDALAAGGESVEARVTGVSDDGGYTYYAYSVNGVEYSWNVARKDAPFPVGTLFPATYSPADPSLSRPGADRQVAVAEAAKNRRFSWKVVLGLALMLLLLAASAHRDLRRIRTNAPSELSDPKAYRRRLMRTALLLLPVLALISGSHIRDAIEKGESILPEVLFFGLVAAIVGGVFFFAAREGPLKAQERSRRILRWAIPLLLGSALLRELPRSF
jgi:hypothetical protein